VFDGADHYSVEVLSESSIRVIVWYDDPGDWPKGQRWARVWTFEHLKKSTDPKYGGAIRPNHKQVLYAEQGIAPTLKAFYPDVRPWKDFDPRRANPMHGQWVSDAQHLDHQAKQSTEGWRTWTEGLASHELDAHGCVKCQRKLGRYLKPSGTRTYYHSDGGLTSVHGGDGRTLVTLANLSGPPLDVSSGIGTNGTDFAYSTLLITSGEPNNAAWPTTGVYRRQLDITVAGADLVFGLLNLGNGDGHFARLVGANDVQTFAQDESSFSGTGLHMATLTDPAWTAGATTDTFENLIAAQKVVGHGNQTLTMQVNETDDFTDGPWPAAAAATENAPFFGTNF
jgi:hypothetical protein